MLALRPFHFLCFCCCYPKQMCYLVCTVERDRNADGDRR
jgi:hypothetical protein